LNHWTLLRDGSDLQAKVTGTDFALDLRFVQTQPLLLQGADGLSRKGPDARQASYYYSLPQLQVSGSITLQGKVRTVDAGSTAWLDHEWSQEVLHPQAVGWDWMGINLFDGSSSYATRRATPCGMADRSAAHPLPGAPAMRSRAARCCSAPCAAGAAR
ncbi:MAG: hypothetical protein RL081_278, partial [Pseudomonadota bacterium]